jgi:hypothetical protein
MSFARTPPVVNTPLLCPPLLTDLKVLIWCLKDKTPQPKTLPFSAPTAVLGAPCNPAKTP